MEGAHREGSWGTENLISPKQVKGKCNLGERGSDLGEIKWKLPDPLLSSIKK